MIVVFCESHSLTGRLIKKIDDTDVSHVAMYSPQIAHGRILFHSDKNGVGMVSRDTFIKRYTIKRCYLVDPIGDMSDHDIVFTLLKTYEDAPYDYFGVGYLGLYLLAKKNGYDVRAKNLWNRRNAFFCTEFVSLGIMGTIPEVISLKTLENYILERMRYELVSFG